MASINIKKCDICKTEKRENKKKEAWKNDFDDVTIRLGTDFSVYQYHSQGHECQRGFFLLCHDCMAKLGITRKPIKERVEAEPLPQEQLYNLFCSIVDRVVEERN